MNSTFFLKIKNVFIKYSFFKNKRKIILKAKAIGTNKFYGHNMVDYGTKLINSLIGFGSYISFNCNIKNAKIGKFSSIGPRVYIGFSTHPTSVWVTTHPAFYMDLRKILGYSFHKESKPLFNCYKTTSDHYLVEIGNDVWIGSDVKIMDGIKIGDGAIVAAGAVVTKNVEPYSIVGGVPAKFLKYRFKEEEIAFLRQFKWWDKSYMWITKNYRDFSEIGNFMKKYSLNPLLKPTVQ